MASMLAPYNDAMRLGMGFNSYTQTLCINNAMIASEMALHPSREEDTSQSVTYSSRFVDKLSDVVDVMKVSYGSSIKKGRVEVEGNSSIDEEKIKTSDLNAVVSVKVVNQTSNLSSDEWSAFNTSLADKVVASGGISQEMKQRKFNEVFGDCFISGFIEGGDFNGIVSIKIINRSNVREVSNSIRNALNSVMIKDKQEFTIEVESSFRDQFGSTATSSAETEITVSVNWKGGGQVKDPSTPWNLDSVFAAAAQFPARVATHPQKTWAILTKYGTNDKFLQWQLENTISSPLEYDNLSSFTAELFENYMEYKQLVKRVQHIMDNRDMYKARLEHLSFEPELHHMLVLRATFRDEMNKIVSAVDFLSLHPGALKNWKSSLLGDAQVRDRMKEIIRQYQYGDTNLSFLSSDPGLDTETPKPAASEPNSEIQSKKLRGANSKDSNPCLQTTEFPDSETFDFNSLTPPEVFEERMPILKDPQPEDVIPSGPDETALEEEDLFKDEVVDEEAPKPEQEQKPTDDSKIDSDTTTESQSKLLLRIHGACWGDSVVTSAIQKMVDPERATLHIAISEMERLFPGVLPGQRKTLSIVYEYKLVYPTDQSEGDFPTQAGMRLFVLSFGEDAIMPGQPSANSTCISYRDAYAERKRVIEPAKFRLWAVVWGDQSVQASQPELWRRMGYGGEEYTATPEGLGGWNPWPGATKTVHIYSQSIKPGGRYPEYQWPMDVWTRMEGQQFKLFLSG